MYRSEEAAGFVRGCLELTIKHVARVRQGRQRCPIAQGGGGLEAEEALSSAGQ